MGRIMLGSGDSSGGGEKWLNYSVHLKALLIDPMAKDEPQSEFKDDAKLFGLSKYKTGVVIN